MKQSLLILLLLAFIMLPATAQQGQPLIVTGTVVDAEDGSPLPGLTVVFQNAADTTRQRAGISNPDGEFELRIFRPGTYKLRLSFVGYETIVRDLVLENQRTDLGTIEMQRSIMNLDNVVVEEVQERFRMRGDTTVFNADAYKVNPDASAQDLVTKLPGVVMQDGQVEAQGEQVQRVTVDGKEFFGGDPSVALQNLPAEAIQSVEVYDRQSDQAQFTGFSDGETQKTINIVTRSGMSNGQFGKIYGGYGDESRYIGGGNMNIFDQDRRISIIGLSNNINQQNFAFEDLLGITGGDSGGMRGGGMRRGGGPPRGGFRGRSGNGFNPRDFLVGQQGGINKTSSVGINYSDELGSKLKLTTSYFFNRMGNANDTFLDRQLFLPGDQLQFYNEIATTASTNYNHRINARLEYTINESNSFIIRPNISFQNNIATSQQTGFNLLDSGSLLNEALNTSSTDNRGYTSSTSILYRHRFPKRGRTISSEFEIGLNDRWGDTDQLSLTEYFIGDAGQDSTFDQVIDNETAGQSFGVDIDYTEPLGENGQLRLSYEPSFGNDVSDRFAFVRDLQTGLYNVIDPSYSSQYDNDVVRHRGGATYRYNLTEEFNIQLGVEVQNENISGTQAFPVAFSLDRNFFTVLPEVELEYEIDDVIDLDLDYSARTSTPSVTQLQGVIDNTNPLFLTSGNPDLEPSFTHNIRLRARRGNWRAGRMMFGFVSFDRETNPIGTASLLAVSDTLLSQGIVLQQGSQFSYPVNLDDESLSLRSFFVMGTPLSAIKSNVNFRGGVSYSKTPGLINDAVNMATQYGFNGGITVASNISERLDFTLSYGGSYTLASNSFYEQLDENFYRHDAGVRFTWLPYGRIVVETNLTYNDFVGLDEDLYPTTFIMNAGLGYKFMQQDAAELKLVVGDIFNQENGINRTINELYIEDSRSQVLGRYILLNLSYKFRDFKM